MILTMAAVAITTRKRSERTCPKCGKADLSTQQDQRSFLVSHAARHRFRRKRGTKTSGKPTIPNPVYRLPISENARGSLTECVLAAGEDRLRCC